MEALFFVPLSLHLMGWAVTLFLKYKLYLDQDGYG